ncbi:MAG: CamS family sex pheromone protein [Bacillus sp. (in: firmicutes)]
MKKFAYVGLAFLLLLSGCSSNNDTEETETKKTEEEEAIIPKYQINEDYYRTILPFEPSEARGQTVSNLNTRYDMNEMELGLMQIAQNSFNTNDYYFKEGQYLDASTVKSWLKRKYTADQLKERDMEESENLGLNPIITDSTDEKANEESPLYLAHILEHNYMVQKSNDSVGLGGVVIGLALNSVHYYQKVEYGAKYEVDISEKKMLSEGQKIAEEVLSRLRQIEGLEEVPITIALYRQEASSSAVPGNFVAYTEVGEGSNKIGSWKELNEDYVLFPSDDASENYRDDSTTFTNFKQDIEDYFPNYNGVIGTGYYIDNQMQQLKIEIPIQFYGKTEVVGFTQYVAGLVLEYFPNYISVEVSVTSVSGNEALIVRNAGDDEPFVHIYQ